MPDDFGVLLERIASLTAGFEHALAASDWNTIETLDQEARTALDFQSLAGALRDPEMRAQATAALSTLVEIHRRALQRAIAEREEVAEALYRFRSEREAAEIYEAVLRHSE